jgi:mycothiol synthase
VILAPQLPAGLQARPARPDDLEAVVALCVRCDVADVGEPDTDLDDIGSAWRRPGYDLERDSVLVAADGRLVGYGDLYEGEAFGMVDPDWRGRGIGAWLVGWMERRAGAGATLGISAPGSDQAFRELAEGRGYRLARSNWLMRLDMPEPPPPPGWPDGVEVRTFDRDADAQAVHRLIQDAFVDIGNQPPRSFEFWAQTTMARADFDPELWFLAVAGGELVGVNLAYAGPLGGYVGHLAVRRDHRGRGLGMALLRNSFGALHRHGMREVYLNVDSENRTGATRLYERAGMVVQHRYDTWVKQLE